MYQSTNHFYTRHSGINLLSGMAGQRNTKKQRWNEMLSLQVSTPSGLYQVVFAEYIDTTNFLLAYWMVLYKMVAENSNKQRGISSGKCLKIIDWMVWKMAHILHLFSLVLNGS